MTKRILSMFLALSMMLSLVPVSAFADTGGGIFFAPSETAELEEHNAPVLTVISPGNDLDIDGNNEPYNINDPSKTSGEKWNYDKTTGTLTLYTYQTSTDTPSFYFAGKTIHVKKLVIDGTFDQNHTIQYGTFKSPDSDPISLEIKYSNHITLHGITFDGNVTWDTKSDNFLYLCGAGSGVDIQGDLNFSSSYSSGEHIFVYLEDACITGTLNFPSISYNLYFTFPSAVHAIAPLGEESEGWLVDDYIQGASQLVTTNGSCKITASYANDQTADFDADTNGQNSVWVSHGTSVTLTGDDTCDGWQLHSSEEIADQTFVNAQTTTFTMPENAVTATAYDALVIAADPNGVPTVTNGNGNGWNYDGTTLTITKGHTFNFDPDAATPVDATHHTVRYESSSFTTLYYSVRNNGTIVGMKISDGMHSSSAPVKLTNSGTITDSAILYFSDYNIENIGTIQQSKFAVLNDDNFPDTKNIKDSVFLADDADKVPDCADECILVKSGDSGGLDNFVYAYFYGSYEPVIGKPQEVQLFLYHLYNINGESPDAEKYAGYFALSDYFGSSVVYYLAKRPTEGFTLNVPIDLKITSDTHIPDTTNAIKDSTGTVFSGNGWSYNTTENTLYLESGTFDFSDQPYVGCNVVVSSIAYIAGGMFKGTVTAAEDNTRGIYITGGLFATNPDKVRDDSTSCVAVDLTPSEELYLCPTEQENNSVATSDWGGSAYVYGDISLTLQDERNQTHNLAVSKVDGETSTLLNTEEKAVIDWHYECSHYTGLYPTWTFAPGKAVRNGIHKLLLTQTAWRRDLQIDTAVGSATLGQPIVDDTYQYYLPVPGAPYSPGYQGYDWRYDPTANDGAGKLSITVFDCAINGTEIYQSKNTILVTVPVDFDTGAGVYGSMVLTQKPTGNTDIINRYHSITMDNGADLTYLYQNGAAYSTPALWVWTSADFGYNDLNHPFDFTLSGPLYNINGKDPAEYSKFIVKKYPNDDTSYVYTFLGTALTALTEDLVLNKTLELTVDENGFPAGSKGGTVSVYGMSGGRAWHFDASTQTLVLESGEFDLSAQNAVTCAVEAAAGASITGGTFTNEVTSEGTITGGTFINKVTSKGAITGGTFTEKVTSEGTITGGTFTQEPETTGQQLVKVTLTGGAGFEGLSDTATAYMAPGAAFQLTYTDAAHIFYGWASQREGEATTYQPMALTAKYTLPTGQQNAVTLSPIVEMSKAELTVSSAASAPYKLEDFATTLGVALIGLRYYALDEIGNRVEPARTDYPTADGHYAVYVLPEAAEPSFAALSGVYYYLPGEVDTGVAFRINNGVEEPDTPDGPDSPDSPDEPDASSGGDSGAGAALVLGTAAVGGAAYLIGTQVWMETNLPNGTIPTNRQQLADMLWAAAGKPEPVSTALYADISAEAVESQKAARWCVEQGLVKDHGESFDPDTYTFRPQVIKAWNDLQARKAQ